ncbi:MAG: hypothetical protein IKJ24_06655 [Clostridia bacterium]|nr:hypothetical protein [Clostridia bacterium]
MAGHRIRKYSRRTRSQYKKSVAPIVLSVIAFLLLSVIISVVIGISLQRRVEETGESDKRFDFPKVEYNSGDKVVSGVEAYNFPKGADAASYIMQDIPDLSVCIRHRDGEMDYYFDVAGQYGFDDMDSTYSFSTLCNAAHGAGGRVCAYLYIGAFEIEDEYQREIRKAYEIALIREAAESGADDILLLGLDVKGDNIAEIEAFVAKAAIAADKTPLGVAVSVDTVAQNDKEIYYAARLRSACDYLALDLTHLTLTDGSSKGEDENGNKLPSLLEETLAAHEYYIKSYPMRVLLASDQSKLYIPTLALGVTDMQIVGE